MKLLVVPVFILLMLLQTFSKWALIWDYTAHRDYIVKNLCENRARPKMHCNGKCQLAKRLAEEEKQSTPGNSFVKATFQEVLFPGNFCSPSIPLLNANPVKKFAYYLIRYYPAPASRVFHPPA
jgi:hypothetical protein